MKFSELMRKMLPAVKSFLQAAVRFIINLRKAWPYIREFLRNAKKDTPLMMAFFREVSIRSWPHVRTILVLMWVKTVAGIRYAANIRRHWPEIKERLLEVRKKAEDVVRYLREIRHHWPEIRERLVFFWSTTVSFSRKAYRYGADIKQHWPGIKTEIYMYKEEIERPKYNRYFAAAAYIPFIGWLIPLYLKREDPFCQNHGKMGFVGAVFFAGAALALFFLDLLFVPRDWRIIRFLMAISIYLVYAAYFPLCARGIYTAISGKKLEMRSIGKYINIIEF